MAWTEFYMDSGGNNMNSGSSSATAASVTSTNGNWNGTSIFTAVSGTPFSGTAVGDWASIYIDGTTSGAVYIAQITTINGGGSGITLSTTNKFGTAPASSATARSCKVGGAWANFDTLMTSLTNTTIASGLSIRVNIKAAAYTETTATDLF
jgi:hypothetical protein